MLKCLSRFWVLTLVIVGISCRSTPSGQLHDDPLRLHHHSFDNGLEMVLSENPGSGPRVSKTPHTGCREPQ
jgi:hypothetical protein